MRNIYILCLLFISGNVLCDNEDKILFIHTNDAMPVSGHFNNGRPGGFCGDLFVYLKDQLKLELKANDISTPDRFKIFEVGGKYEDYKDKKVILCSSSTITNKRKKEQGEINGEFSDPFYVSSLKLIAKKDIGNILTSGNFKKNYWILEGKSIGVIGSENNNVDTGVEGVCSLDDDKKSQVDADLVTSSAIKNVFPTSTIKFVKDRNDAIACLKDNKIDAFASDEIILYGIKEDLEKAPNSEKYDIYPKHSGYTNEPYGVLIYNENDGLIKKINSWINSDDGGVRSIKEKESVIDFNFEIEIGDSYHVLTIRNNLAYYIIISSSIFLFLLFLFFLVRRFKLKKLSDYEASKGIEDYDIFLSYSRSDVDFVKSFEHKLKKEGYKVWRDTHSLRGGERINAAIVKAMRRSKCFIPIISENSNDSDWVFGEIDEAVKTNKKVIPVHIDKSHIPMRLRALNVIEIESKGNFILPDNLVKSINETIA